MKLTVGDHSSSESERYNLKVGPITHQAPEYGVVEERVYPFEVGKTYEIEIIHVDSNLPMGVKYSDMLTVWRKLWVERDDMAPVAMFSL